ncbi:MAG: GNAT family N-acetyltransferase [Burkholderiales bacterium RIFCSPLOWO2_12_FULL_61_40]|nr:MAG: GNAT family N-acetyltransferase [Burkholderiales bacterium RIFCSPLOWO2_12_FULL_61_40]
MNITILPTAEAHFHGLYQAIDTVAREQRYLAFTQAPPIEQSFAFFRNIVQKQLCQVVALRDGAVVGWCDVLPTFGDARAHVGTLGIGLIPNARHCGIGAQLMQAALSAAWAQGLSRIELTVRVDNPNARALYARFGFVNEGLHRRAFCIEGDFFDSYAMALLR